MVITPRILYGGPLLKVELSGTFVLLKSSASPLPKKVMTPASPVPLRSCKLALLGAYLLTDEVSTSTLALIDVSLEDNLTTPVFPMS